MGEDIKWGRLGKEVILVFTFPQLLKLVIAVEEAFRARNTTYTIESFSRYGLMTCLILLLGIKEGYNGTSTIELLDGEEGT